MKNFKTSFKKALSILLVAIMLVMILPASVYADAIESFERLSRSSEDTDLIKNVFEDEALREEYVKHFVGSGRKAV